MSRHYNKIMVVDLECTCEDVTLPSAAMMRPEIIEIGVVVLDRATLETVEEASLICFPLTMPITPFCTKLTTIDEALIKKEGITLKEAVQKLIDMKSKKSIFTSWGEFDRRVLIENMNWFPIDSNPFNNIHLNIKSLYAAKTGISCGVDAACKALNIPFEGTHHRGIDDARMIAKILREII